MLCYLFGSESESCSDAVRDLDLGVVLREYPARSTALKKWSDLHDDLQALFAPRTLDLVLLQHAPLVLQWEAINGKLIYKSDDLARADYEEHVMRRWMDLRWWYDKQLDEAMEAVHAGHF